MMTLINTIKKVMGEQDNLPFAVYSSIKEQHILNVPVAKPMLIVVLNGTKEIGNGDLTCTVGDFVFLSNSPSLDIRNIPANKAYFALLITFEPEDFEGLAIHTTSPQHYCAGKAPAALTACLAQFVESVLWAPEHLWPLRKKEILELLCHSGYKNILSMLGQAKVSQQLHDLLLKRNNDEVSLEDICNTLAMSESTLRRKLKLEGTSVQKIKDQTRLGLGLHLLQTTYYSISLIAEKCGYQSQSRFTERFKKRFGITPSELRKTKLTD